MIQYIIAAGIGALLGSSKKKAKKMGHGGKTQGYNSRLDESLSMRHGAGRKKQQSRKDRRDESAAMERSMGRRKYASVSTMDRGRREMAHGGTTDKAMKKKRHHGRYAEGGIMSGAEERAIAEYMEDYGVDREQAEYQFLGEFRNKEDWAAEYVDNLGGIEQFMDPERFLEVDKIGFREWAMNMADAMSSDLDDSELEDAAERQGLKFEYMEAEEEGGKAFEDLRRDIADKEYDEQYEYFMSEGDSVEGVLDLLGNYGVQGIEDASDLYVVRVDYEEVADALEDDGVVFIEEDFKTFVFDPNMRRGGRTKCTSCGNKRMAKGGQIPIPKEVLSGKEFIALVKDESGKPHMKFSKTFNGAKRMADNMVKKFRSGGEYAIQKFDPFYGASFYEEGIFIPPSKEFRKGGKTKRKKVSDFDKLAMKVAARYRAEGKSNKEAMEIGRGTAAKVYRAQQAKRGAKGRKGRK